MARTKASQGPFFPLLGEPLALDFVNTVICRDPDTEAVDLISQPYRWGQWLDYQWLRLEPIVGLALTEYMRSPECLHRVRELRDAARVVINAARLARSGGPNLNTTTEVTTVNEAEGHATGHAAVMVASTASMSTASMTTATVGLERHLQLAQFEIEALLRALAVSTVRLATSAEATAIRECQAPGCGLMFVPRHPARRWCSSWTCGNRTRAAHHYQRRRVPTDRPPV